MTDEIDPCYKCGGIVETEIVGDYRDYVCSECGTIIDSEELTVENQQAAEVKKEFEVME